MYYSPAMDEIKDFTDLATAFTGDIRHGFISQAEGNGMEKAGICSGDYLLFTRDREPENGDIVFLEVYGQSMCRRIFFEQVLPEKKACIRIRREDGNTPDLVADERDVRISGVFEGLVRNLSRKKNREKFKYLSSAQAEQDAVRLEKSQQADDQPGGRKKSIEDPSVSICYLDLPVRILNRLTGIGMHTIQDILDIPDKEALLAIPGLGKASYEQILHCLEKEGFDCRHLHW